MEHLYRQAVHHVSSTLDRMGPQEWFWVMAAMIVVAVVCMRGFGSRSGY